MTDDICKNNTPIQSHSNKQNSLLMQIKKTKKKIMSSNTNINEIRKTLDQVANKHRKIKIIQSNDDENVEEFYKKTEELKNKTSFCEFCNLELSILDYTPICKNCGYICEDVFDHSPEWKTHGSDDKIQTDPSRCGNPINPLLEQLSYTIKIKINYRSTLEMKKLKKLIDWSGNPNNEKMLNDEFNHIYLVCSQVGITTNIIERAKEIYTTILEIQMFRGIIRQGIQAASVYISFKENGVPRTPQEMATIFKIDKSYVTSGISRANDILQQIKKNYNETNNEFNNETNNEQSISNLNISVENSIDYIPRFCSKLNIKDKLQVLCMCVAEKIDNDQLITDHASHCIAAGIIYFISLNYNNGNITKQMIESETEISDVTINKCYLKIESIKDKLKDYIIKKLKLNKQNNKQ